MLWQRGKAYSQDLRGRVLAAADDGEPVGRIATLLCDVIARERVLCFEGFVATATDRTDNSVAATRSPAAQIGCFAGRDRGPGDQPSGCHDCGVAGLAV